MTAPLITYFITNDSNGKASFARMSKRALPHFWTEHPLTGAMWMMNNPAKRLERNKDEPFRDVPEGFSFELALQALQEVVSMHPVLLEHYPHVADLVDRDSVLEEEPVVVVELTLLPGAGMKAKFQGATVSFWNWSEGLCPKDDLEECKRMVAEVAESQHGISPSDIEVRITNA